MLTRVKRGSVAGAESDLPCINRAADLHAQPFSTWNKASGNHCCTKRVTSVAQLNNCDLLREGSPSEKTSVAP